MQDTIFGKITRGEIPTEFLYEDDQCVVIRDIHPQAPTHVLIIPRKPIPRVGDAFRLVINNGEGGGQTVFHLHLHILAGREMTEGQLTAGLN